MAIISPPEKPFQILYQNYTRNDAKISPLQEPANPLRVDSGLLSTLKEFKVVKSCISLEPANRANFKHNDRSQKQEPKHLLPTAYRLENEASCSSESADKKLSGLYEEASKNYQKTVGQKIQAKKFIWEACVNLNKEHTLEDLKKLAKALEEETGFTTLQIAIHRDEGKINERGFPVYNFHAHISFFTLDRKTGQQLYRRQITKKQKEKQPNLKPMNTERMSKLQDITADLLNMERGKRGSTAKHLKPAQFRELKEREKQIEKLESLAYDLDTIEPMYDDRGVMLECEFYHPSYKEKAEQLQEKNNTLLSELKEKDAQIAVLVQEKEEALAIIEDLSPTPQVHPLPW